MRLPSQRLMSVIAEGRCKPLNGTWKAWQRSLHCWLMGQPFAEAVQRLLGASVQVAKRHELHTFAVMPQRWVVERSFAWLEKCRRLWKNTERLLNTSLQFANLAFLALLLRRY